MDSYWSSKRHYHPKVSSDNLSLITKILIASFQAMFQDEFPIYSSKFVRFRMGHPKSSSDIDRDFLGSQEDSDDKFIWTYTSETFLMAQEMEARIDFLQMLDIDLVFTILMCLNDPADLVRASAVSKSWQMFVISYGICKKLCMKKCPQLASITHVTEQSDNSIGSCGETSNATLRREHTVYASPFRALTSFPIKFYVAYPISTSSINHPGERIINPLHPRDQDLYMDSYWSSKGHYGPKVPETLIYDLSDNLYLITEILIAHFQAMFQEGFPIYSSRFVRFRMGHPKSDSRIDRYVLGSQVNADDKFIWTYTSESLPMAQESCLQSSKLPEPVLFIGGFMQIELLGRVQKQQADVKYYICLSHVQAIGRQLSPAFRVDISRPSNTISLRYNAEAFSHTLKDTSGVDNTPFGINPFPIVPPRDLVWGNL